MLFSERFGVPGAAAEQPSILDVSRPLMDAAKILERAGTMVVSISGDDRVTFDGGTQLVLCFWSFINNACYISLPENTGPMKSSVYE